MGINLEVVRKMIDEEGKFLSGPYDGLDIIPVIEAMEASSWDYPSAMAKIGEILGVKAWADINAWSMHPPLVGLYIHLEMICPEVDGWDRAPVEWPT